MGIKGSLLISLLLHVSILAAVISFMPSLRKENDLVRISLSSVRIEKVPQKTHIKRTPERKRSPKKRAVKRKKAIVKKKAEKKPKRTVVKRKTPKKEAIKQRKVVARPKESKPRVDKPSVKESPRTDKPQPKRVAKSPATNPTLPVKKSTSRTLGRAAQDQVKGSSVESAESYQERYREENLSVIREAILSYLRYPPIARRMGWEGTVLVRFTLLPDGRLGESRVEKGSGHKVLDRSALEAVKLAHKDFPKPREKVTLVIPIVYRLE